MVLVERLRAERNRALDVSCIRYVAMSKHIM